MLRKAHGLIGAKIHALDGELGHVDDFFFDDLQWKVRYMIVRTGSWFNEKHVMLSPSSIRDVVWQDQVVYVDLTQDQIKQSPDLDVEKPVTREQEMELARHYEWPSYWMGPSTGLGAVGVNAMGVYPVMPVSDPSSLPDHLASDISSTDVAEPQRLRHDDPVDEASRADAELRRAARAEGLKHELHSVKKVTGYHIAASDGDIGHVEDFFIEEEGWQVQYLLIDTKNWLPGRQVLISTDWIDEIMWEDKHVHVQATRDQVKHSPEYDPQGTLDRAYESRLHEHYGYPPYWA